MASGEGGEKKISFGFSKSIKKPALNKNPQPEKKVDYIECLDEKSIKVVGGEEKKDEPLVIPMLGSKTWHDRILNKVNADIFEPKVESVTNGNESDIDIKQEVMDDTNDNGIVPATDVAQPMEIVHVKEEILDEPVKTLEEQAADEILQDLKQEQEETKEISAVPLPADDSLVGKQESTLEDYEQIPIDKFGEAMLRGMGWQPGRGIGKNENQKTSRFKRKTDRGNFDLENAVQAVKAVKLDKKALRVAAKKYNVPKSTLWRYVDIVSKKYEDVSSVPDEQLREAIQHVGTYAACATNQVFTTEQEKALVKYIKKCSDDYYGLNIAELRQLAYQFAKEKQIKYPPSWDDDKMSGRDWYYGFMRRHNELTLRTPEQRDASKTSNNSLKQNTTKSNPKTPAKRSRPPRKVKKQESSDDNEDEDISINTTKLISQTLPKLGRPPKKVKMQQTSDGDEN